MSDMPSYDKAKAAVRQKETPLNNDGGKGQVVCSTNQAKNATKGPAISRGHPYADKRS